MILINGKLDGNAKVDGTSLSSTCLGIPIKIGQTITLPATTYKPGQTIEITIQNNRQQQILKNHNPTINIASLSLQFSLNKSKRTLSTVER